MGHCLEDVLKGREGNYILPFFWQHAEEEATLRKYMREIRSSGIRAVCVESRPHPDYAGPKWWRDMDVILEEARILEMKVWVLDDAHFPTGYCNGRIEEHPEYGKVFLDHTGIDVMGPAPYSSFLLNLEPGERLLGVVGAKRTGCIPGEWEKVIDLSGQVSGERLYWDVPQGYWNVIILKETIHSEGRKNYCNLIDADAVRFFLDTVYEPHWEHYQSEFGKTFAGFFSDEPELGNAFGAWPDTGIGQPTMALPWCAELEQKLRLQWGEEWCICLAALWNRPEGIWQRARYEYMHLLTNLYGVNFCGQVGEWCSAHGVEYIGHVIEDNGNHTRTGYGAGHYFKALWGQHMAGIDVVLQQIRPGYDDRSFYHIGGKNTYDGRFFHYGLAKLGTSLAHLDAKKQGRTMCEIYGAYGWSEGLKLMKWLTDHMLVRGVNWFVPHAFSPAAFPDADCPPHFYAHGNHPQYPWFKELMHYMNRMCHLFQGGAAVVNAAVLYTAEPGWMGRCEPFEVLGKLLLQHQIDYDVVPMGVLDTMEEFPYRILLIPECESIPQELDCWIRKAVGRGVKVLFAGKRPEVFSCRQAVPESFPGWAPLQKEQEDPEQEELLQAVFCNGDTEEIIRTLEEMCICRGGIRLRDATPWLRCYTYQRAEGTYYLLFQEHPRETFQGTICLPKEEGQEGEWYRYEPWENRIWREREIADGELELRLEPYETVVLYHGTMPDAELSVPYQRNRRMLILEKGWEISVKGFREKRFTKIGEEAPFNVTSPEKLPDFSGLMCYETVFRWNAAEEGDTALLDCGQVYETLEVWLNGVRQGVRIAPPYRIKVEGLRQGENTLKLIVANTLVHALKDPLSATMPLEPGGLLGPVELYTVGVC